MIRDNLSGQNIIDIDSVGKDISQKQKHCSRHGDYISTQKLLFTHAVWTGCPDCLREHLKKDSLNKDDKTQLLSSVGVEPRFINSSIKNYIPANKTQERAKEVVSRYGKGFSSIKDGSGIILTGDTDAGKTHLVSALIHGLALNGYRVKLITAIALIKEVRKSFNDKLLSEEDIINRFAELDLLAIDEVGVQAGSNAELVTLFEIINRRYNLQKPTIVVSNMGAEELSEFLTPRTYRRIIGNGLVVNVEKEGNA
jgi:DNA replication protein DnaC